LDPESAAWHASRQELDRLTAGTQQVRRVGHPLNQAVMTMHATDRVNATIEDITTIVSQKIEVLDDAAMAVGGSLQRAKHQCAPGINVHLVAV
jgi:hypothetical protein